MTHRYNIGCATDSNYAQHLGIMICSMLTNTSSPELFDIYVVDGGILAKDIQRFKEIEKKFSCNINFLKPDRKYFDKLKVFEIYSEATYYRYFLLDTLPVEKLLYLDCDMIVEGDVTELYNINQEGNIISACVEVLCPVEHLKTIGLTKSFNAGMILVNCKKWQQEKISQKAYQYQIENEHIVEFPDQDSLNVTLQDSWQIVPYRWNVIARLGLVNLGIGSADYRYYSKEDVFHEYNNPKIIHYANRLFKPWFWLDPSPYKKNYLKYKAISPWASVPFADKSLIGVINRILYYFSFVFKYIKN